ncbi:uncharacterized protein LOC121652269 [Melanotaenia boesemani]|uniref:uncharacterized protein LOC121652269 n=1 Tax=Melanotaenia boesemani TaxID=1250792 RepID=UPI001C05274D|nr:uncharacterized protein LOC121652269 [Melanotaenia boesemani]
MRYTVQIEALAVSEWTDEDVERLVPLRVAEDHLFNGRRFASAAGWEAVLQKMGLSREVSPARAAKKWENLKKTYKELRKPPTGTGTETEEPTAASWKWFSLMDEAIGSKPSVRPPCLIASSWEESPSTSVAPSSVSVPHDEEDEGESSTPAKRPRLESLLHFLEKAEKREEEREKREEEREKKEEERQERLLSLLEKIIEKIK